MKSGAKIQRIRYASNETNYCAKCQTGGTACSRIAPCRDSCTRAGHARSTNSKRSRADDERVAPYGAGRLAGFGTVGEGLAIGSFRFLGA